jgi:hypothetical protein
MRHDIDRKERKAICHHELISHDTIDGAAKTATQRTEHGAAVAPQQRLLLSGRGCLSPIDLDFEINYRLPVSICLISMLFMLVMQHDNGKIGKLGRPTRGNSVLCNLTGAVQVK